MKLPKKIASLLTVTLVAGSGLGNLTTVDAAQGAASETLVGKGRWETAIEISKKGWSSAKEAVIVNDSALADALTATPFAEAKDAPMLLTQNNKLDERIKAELKRLGVQKVYLIGGTNVLKKSVEDALKAEKLSVDRIWGNTRYETSLEIAKRLDSTKDVSEIAVVNGDKGLVDAISVAPVAADKDMPVILSHPSKGTQVSDEFIKGEDIKTSYIIGGTSAVSNEIGNKFPNAKRLDGANRNETNAKVIETFYTEKELKNAYVAKDGMAKESELIDGLAVGVLAAKNDSPVVLVRNGLNQKQKDVTNTKSFKTITQVGGGSNKAGFDQLRSMQEVTTYNVKTVVQLNESLAKADANDVIDMNLVTRADINEEIVITTTKKIAINLSGNYENTITVSAPNAKIVNKGTISKLVVKDSVGGKVENASGATISNIEIQGSASKVEIVNDGTVTNIKNDASGTIISNSGTITNNPTGSQNPSLDGNRPGGSTGGGSSSGGSTVVTTANASNEAELIKAIDNSDIKTIILNDTIDITTSLDGRGKKITVDSTTTDHALQVAGKEDVEISDLTIENAKGFGIQYYNSTGSLSNVTIKNSAKGGLLVNGSTVNATNLVTEGNAWYGVNVDKGQANEEREVLFKVGEGCEFREDVQIQSDKATLDLDWVVADGYLKEVVEDDEKTCIRWSNKVDKLLRVEKGDFVASSQGLNFDPEINTFSGVIPYFKDGVRTPGNYVEVKIIAPENKTVTDDAYLIKNGKKYPKEIFDETDYLVYRQQVLRPGQTDTLKISWDGTTEEKITIKIDNNSTLETLEKINN
ncbi:cell wall-binding repeat-containing protein [Faecalimicrobium sp. JNUCC 81]